MKLARIDLRGQQLSAAQLRAVLPRGGVDVDSVLPKVRPIVDAVVERGAGVRRVVRRGAAGGRARPHG